MDIFQHEAFSQASLTHAASKIPFRPRLLGQMGLFQHKHSFTTVLKVERRDGVLRLVPTSPRGAPHQHSPGGKREIQFFEPPRLQDGFTLYADELQNIRQFASNELADVQREFAERKLQPRDNLELTMEHHRVGAVQGIVLDADGETVLIDWFEAWGIERPEAIVLDLDTAEAKVRLQCMDIRRRMARAAKGLFGEDVRIVALTGDSFFDKLISHPEVERTYLNHSAAAELREGKAYDRFTYGNIEFVNYRGTDDQSTVAIPTDEARFFPVGVPDLFQVGFAPGESYDAVNRKAQELYARVILDRDRDEWSQYELTSYPLHICTRPEVLLTGKVSA
ncbi:major capsid protein [Fodinicurvata sp. EGI_FJ10296]|uniref:major capsid protein n=1 Tax=Fodinicurvata sp. EGI_FJ10296 TaxID=3231908 RepID=UPI0034559D4F